MCRKLFSFIFLMISLTGAALMAAPSAYSCENAKAEWQAVTLTTPNDHSKLIEWSAWREQKDLVLKCLAKNAFSDFLQNGKKILYREELPDSLDQTIFLNELQKEAIDQTLAYFNLRPSPEVQSFRADILKRSSTTGLGFTLTESGAAMEDRPAGYVRAQGHIIMNYSVMTRDDWLFLFIHEFSHFTDSNLERAVQSAVSLFKADPKLVFHILEEIKSVSTLSELDEAHRLEIDQYLALSLERGWIAEVRAWARTLSVYESLKRDQLISSVEWADQMIVMKKSSQNWMKFFSVYLSSRFSYPDNPIYKNPLLLKRSHEIEQVILKSL